jgi:cysteine-S-conjugate beta-lyase
MPDNQVFAPSLSDLRQRHSSKWRRFSSDVLPMHVAEMDFQVAEPIQAVLTEMIQNSDLGYLGPVPEVAEAFAEFAAARWNWPVDTKQVKMATDVGVAAVEIFRALGKPGDQVVINTPVYSAFFGWLAETHLTPIDVPLVQNGAEWLLDLEELEQAFANGAKFYLLCHPHNPLGKVFSRDELTAVAALAARYDVLVISDEIHAPLTYAGEVFTPYLNCGPDAEATGVTITSSSKSWNTAGLKAAIVVSQSSEVAAKLAKLPPDMHWRSSLLGAFAMVEAYRNGTTWLDSAIEAIEANYQHMVSEVAAKLPGVVIHRPVSGYLSWWDVSALNLGTEPGKVILERAKVAVVEGSDLGGAAAANYTGFIRFNFGTSPANITEAIDRIAALR